MDRNSTLHLAVVTGYIRHCLSLDRLVKAGERTTVTACLEVACAHLDRDMFADVREEASFEILEFIKDGLLDDAEGRLYDAREGKHDVFWRLANHALAAMEHDPVAPEPIKPEWLKLD